MLNRVETRSVDNTHIKLIIGGQCQFRLSAALTFRAPHNNAYFYIGNNCSYPITFDTNKYCSTKHNYIKYFCRYTGLFNLLLNDLRIF